MTNTELREMINTLRGKVVSEKKITALLQIGLGDLYSLVPGFWTKTSESFTLASSGTDSYLVNLKTKFSDFKSLRFLWTSDGTINYIGEKRFRIEVPDPSLNTSGRPTQYFFREKNLIELWPRNSTSRTIYLSYRYRPALDDIEVVPEDWHFVVFYYIMGLFEGKNNNFYKNKYADGLERMRNFAKESEEEFSDIIGDGQSEIIYSEMEESTR